MRIEYRPEIDGLRALAVLSVILFHIGFEIVSGGVVGVDVFFVISGYLITSITSVFQIKDRATLQGLVFHPVAGHDAHISPFSNLCRTLKI
ncbi:MAG: hypothetical protein ACI8WB_002448 [Phenylobacterium sp.]|jgi:hypothetical protein